MNWITVVCPLLVAWLINAEFYDTFTGREVSAATFAEFRRLQLTPVCIIEIQKCDPKELRRPDYSCNNPKYPSRGAMLTPYRRMLPPEFGPEYTFRRSQSGMPLPLVRNVRTAILPDGRVASKKYTQLLLHGIALLIGESTSAHDVVNYVFVNTQCCTTGGDNPVCMPILIPDDDIHLRYSNVRCMNLTRSVTYQDLGCVPRNVPPERINTNPPMLDLSFLYGNDEASQRRYREFTGGRLNSDIVNGKEWPPTGGLVCVQNNPPRETRCHNGANAMGNSLVGPNTLLIWTHRQHNDIARKLQALNRCWDDDRLFRETKEIVTALRNQITYYDLLPNVMGSEFLLKNKVIYNTYGHINEYDDNLIPQLSMEFTIGARYFHAMTDGRMKLYDKQGNMVDELKVVDLTMHTGILPNNRTIDKITQSFFRQPCASEKVKVVDPEMGERVLGRIQFASDIMSVDILKNRDLGLPGYTKYLKICGLKVPKDFDDLLEWMPEETVDGLRINYERVEDIDLLVGMIGEKLMPQAVIGPTLACILVDQLRHWKRADRFWYENNIHPGSFTPEQLYEIRKITQARVICDYGDDVDAVQPNVWLIPKKGNEIVSCNQIPPGPSMDPWKDPLCDKKYSENVSKKSQLLYNSYYKR